MFLLKNAGLLSKKSSEINFVDIWFERRQFKKNEFPGVTCTMRHFSSDPNALRKLRYGNCSIKYSQYDFNQVYNNQIERNVPARDERYLHKRNYRKQNLILSKGTFAFVVKRMNSEHFTYKIQSTVSITKSYDVGDLCDVHNFIIF